MLCRPIPVAMLHQVCREMANYIFPNTVPDLSPSFTCSMALFHNVTLSLLVMLYPQVQFVDGVVPNCSIRLILVVGRTGFNQFLLQSWFATIKIMGTLIIINQGPNSNCYFNMHDEVWINESVYYSWLRRLSSSGMQVRERTAIGGWFQLGWV